MIPSRKLNQWYQKSAKELSKMKYYNNHKSFNNLNNYL